MVFYFHAQLLNAFGAFLMVSSTVANSGKQYKASPVQNQIC